MELSPWQIRADGTVLATFASAVETADDLDNLPDRRFQAHHVANRHGIWMPEDGGFYDARTFPLLIWVAGCDVDGQVTHPNGVHGHLRENVDNLHAIFGKRGYVTLQRDLPFRDVLDPATLTVEAEVLIRSKVTSRKRDGAVRALAVNCLLPWPFWHELPVIAVDAGDPAFTTGGTLPVANQILVFAGDGTLTDDHGADIEIAGSTAAVTVDIRKGEVYQSGVLRMDLLRLGTDPLEHWMEWPARTSVTLTADVGVAVTYHNAR